MAGMATLPNLTKVAAAAAQRLHWWRPGTRPAQDLVQRLEGVLMQWTRRVREVAAHQDAGDTAGSAGPLAELAFWRMRSTNLCGIRDQLNSPGMCKRVCRRNYKHRRLDKPRLTLPWCLWEAVPLLFARPS